MCTLMYVLLFCVRDPELCCSVSIAMLVAFLELQCPDTCNSFPIICCWDCISTHVVLQISCFFSCP